MLSYITCLALFFKINCILSDQNNTNHSKYGNITNICANKDIYCKSNNTNVCGITMFRNIKLFKDYDNACYLFLGNMCDSDKEYHIVTSGSCKNYLANRRSDDFDYTNDTVEETTREENYDETGGYTLSERYTDTTENTEMSTENTEMSTENTEMPTENTEMPNRPIMRIGPIYKVDYSYDDHMCPHSCPNIYDPVCVNINRGYGKYFKMLQFVNHCESDVYYCKHYDEFEAPPNEPYPKVQNSLLGWSYCGASRYMQFNRFSEALSSMGHYGWLAGDYSYSHILEAHERKPGYGKK